MAKSFEELMELYGSNKIGNADMALGRNNPGALETILKERQNWANATTQEEKTAAHNRAENIRKAYGSYSGGGESRRMYCRIRPSVPLSAPPCPSWRAVPLGCIGLCIADTSGLRSCRN